MTDRVACPACGTPNDVADAYCGACGSSLRPPSVPPLACWSCRAPNPPGRAYCGQCGQPLAGPAAPARSAPDRGRSNGVLLALLVVAVAALVAVTGFLLLTRGDDQPSSAGGASASPTAALEPPLATLTPAPEDTRQPEATPTTALPPVPSLGPPGSFACYTGTSIDGPVGTEWNLVRVHFRTQRGFDRVIYELQLQERSEDGIRPSVFAGQSIPGEGEFVGEPGRDPDAEARINVVLANGVRDRVRLTEGYEPDGMRIVERLWTKRYRSHVNYATPEDDPRMAAVGVLSSIDVIGEGCLALRVLGWDDRGDDTAWVFVDIERPTTGPDPAPVATPRPTTGPALPGEVPGPPTAYTCGPTPTTVVGDRDPNGYRLYEIGFETYRDYERVILRLRRSGTGSGPPLAEARLLEAEALDPDTLPADVTAAVAMRLEGVSDGVRLDGYQPRGMRIVEMVSTSAGDDTTYPNVLLSSDGCYQLRVPAWQSNTLGIDGDRVDVYIDFER